MTWIRRIGFWFAIITQHWFSCWSPQFSNLNLCHFLQIFWKIEITWSGLLQQKHYPKCWNYQSSQNSFIKYFKIRTLTLFRACSRGLTFKPFLALQISLNNFNQCGLKKLLMSASQRDVGGYIGCITRKLARLLIGLGKTAYNFWYQSSIKL